MELLTALWYTIFAYAMYKVCDYFYRQPILWSVTSRRILITGCDTGFGHELAKRLDDFGCHVIAACLTEAGEQELKRHCCRRLKTVRMDVTDPASVKRAYAEVLKFLPEGFGLWGLVNNAGIAGAVGPIEWLQLKDYRKVFDVNILGMIDVTTTFLPLIKRGKGRIVNTSSVVGRISFMNVTPYGIAKYGVECFSDALRRQLHDFDVSVHLIEPGLFNTNINNLGNYERLARQAWDQSSEEIKEEYGQEYLESFVNVSIKGFIPKTMSNNIQSVVDTYSQALLSRFPRDRYVVGFDARFILIPIQYLPEWLGDWLLQALARKRPIPRAVKGK